MTIGLALAGLAAIAAAAHPRGARSLMGLNGTPEEHAARFREYVERAKNENLPLRIRIGFVERAWAEADWTSIPPAEHAELVNLQNTIENSVVTSLPLPGPAKARLRAEGGRPVDPRNPPAGWKRGHVFKGVIWVITSLGAGRYVAIAQDGTRHEGTGNTVLNKIHGYSMDLYTTLDLGKPGKVFDPNAPGKGWWLAST